MSTEVSQHARDVVDAVYRSESRHVLATLIRLLGDFDLAEEGLHDAFAAALDTHHPTPAVEVGDDADQPTLFDPDSLLKRIPTDPTNQPTQLPTASATDRLSAGTRTPADVYEAAETAQQPRFDVDVDSS